MVEKINLLITSVGRRSQLLDYFRRSLEGIGRVIVTDCSPLAPALYDGDAYYIVPRIDDPDYIDVLKRICMEEEIRAVFSLIDPELDLLAKHEKDFEAIGVKVFGSSYEACRLWLDKYRAFNFLRRHGFNCAQTYHRWEDFMADVAEDKVDFPVVIKPRFGSASLHMAKAQRMDEARVFFEADEDKVIQPFIEGQELGVDVYVDRITKRVVDIFIKEKLAFRAGEADKSRSVKSEKLFQIIEDLVLKAGLVGPIDIDVFHVAGDYYISEINPRFGGSYPLAYECGCDFPSYMINNLKGVANSPQIGAYEENIYMMKQDSLKIKKEVEGRQSYD